MVASAKEDQARRQLNWNGGGMYNQYKLLSELLSDQAAFITSPKTRLANYWGALPPCPPVSTGLKRMGVVSRIFGKENAQCISEYLGYNSRDVTRGGARESRIPFSED